MATASTSSTGTARYRTGGGGRELAQDTEIFSLEDEGHTEDIKTAGTGTSEKSRLFDCPLDSDEEEDKITPKKPPPAVKNRLEMNFEGDGDSLSDELDLLPPLPGAPNANSSWFNKFHSLNCCNPRIPSKCLIM